MFYPPVWGSFGCSQPAWMLPSPSLEKSWREAGVDRSPMQEEGSFLIVSLYVGLRAPSFAFSVAVSLVQHQLALADSCKSCSLGSCSVIPRTSAAPEVPR